MTFAVPRSEVHKIEPLVLGALERDPDQLEDPQSVWASLLSGKRTCWLSTDGDTPKGFTIVAIRDYGKKRRCEIDFCAGEDIRFWVSGLAKIEGWARENGCTSMVIPHGRKGWARLLEDYDVTRFVMEKGL